MTSYSRLERCLLSLSMAATPPWSLSQRMTCPTPYTEKTGGVLKRESAAAWVFPLSDRDGVAEVRLADIRDANRLRIPDVEL